ncbi:MAG: tautomerase family protein [Mesorhizobium sp.]
MPFVRTAMPKGTEQSRKLRIVQGIHEALVEGIGMPQDELFNLVAEYGDG